MRVTFLIVLISSTLFLSCVSIKPSTAELSAQIGSRITEMQRIHQLSLQRYFDMEQQRIEDFLTNEWEPLFLKNFLGTSQVLQLLQEAPNTSYTDRMILEKGIALYLMDTTEAKRAAADIAGQLDKIKRDDEKIVRTVLTKYVEDNQLNSAVVHVTRLLGTDEPAQIILEFAEAAHKEMLAQRMEMLSPIHQARREAMAALSEAYAEMIRGQSVLTARLDIAAKRSRQQDELLGKLGVKPVSQEAADQMNSITDKVNKALGNAQSLLLKEDGSPRDIIIAIKEALR